jgi:hypothetical protein
LKGEIFVEVDGAPEGIDEIEDVLGDDQVAIVKLEVEELAAARGRASRTGTACPSSPAGRVGSPPGSFRANRR